MSIMGRLNGHDQAMCYLQNWGFLGRVFWRD